MKRNPSLKELRRRWEWGTKWAEGWLGKHNLDPGEFPFLVSTVREWIINHRNWMLAPLRKEEWSDAPKSPASS